MQQQNALLAAAGTGLRLELRGSLLGLRGLLPPRRGSGRPQVQRLSLGLPANESGLGQALGQLLQVQQQLDQGRFDWQPWIRQQRHRSPARLQLVAAPAAPQGGGLEEAQQQQQLDRQLEKQLVDFEQAFFADPRRRRQAAGSRSTWRAAYRPYLRRLQQQGPALGLELGPELLLAVLEGYPLASRSRQQCGVALAALARHCDLSLPGDWTARAGGYGLHLAQFRQLPSDHQILQLVERIPNPRWRLAYGLMATYGLRNHEVFFCDLSALAPGGDRVIRVLPTSKTGEHQVWPFQPDWVERFELERLGCDPGSLPQVATDLRRTTLQQAGRRLAEQFRRYDLPITPYDLRHAWAVRTIHIGLPDTVAARMMGHSVAIHTRTYHHWITRRDQQQAVDTALARRQPPPLPLQAAQWADRLRPTA
ncbi:MAG: site-specific integrase [Prochlorococcaceae cyanobacterium]